MKPLSVLKYYTGNRRRFIPVFTALGLSVFLIYMVQVLISAPMKTTYRELVVPYQHFSSFAAKTKTIDSAAVNEIASLQGVKNVYPCMFAYTNIDSIIGGTVGTQVVALSGRDMQAATGAMGLTLACGRLPRPGSNDIALHTLVARNKGLRIGDSIGSDLQKNEVLEGKFIVCGMLDGESILSVNSLEYELARRKVGYEYSLGALVVPQDGKLQAINNSLAKMNGSGTVKRTLHTVSLQFAQDTSSITALLTAISMMTIAIVSVCAGFLSYIYFLQRRSEFGILSAIGFTLRQVIIRAFAEIMAVNLAGLAAGVLLSAIAVLALNAMLFAPKGLMLPVLDTEALLKSCCAPLFTTLFSIIPVWRMLKGLDAAGILEGQVQP